MLSELEKKKGMGQERGSQRNHSIITSEPKNSEKTQRLLHRASHQRHHFQTEKNKKRRLKSGARLIINFRLGERK